MLDLSSTSSYLSDSSTSLRTGRLEGVGGDWELHASFTNDEGPRALCKDGTPLDGPPSGDRNTGCVTVSYRLAYRIH